VSASIELGCGLSPCVARCDGTDPECWEPDMALQPTQRCTSRDCPGDGSVGDPICSITSPHPNCNPGGASEGP
jgi:hypothetical protein